jgi:hypothetical protein
MELGLEASLLAATKSWLLDLLASSSQPPAAELIRFAEDSFGWRIRQTILPAIRDLRDDLSVRSYDRDYLRITLSDEAINQALRGDAKGKEDYQSTLDDLFRRSALYRDSVQFKEAVAFTARFRDYAPYNNMLVRLQRPSCCFYATERDWNAKFDRTLKEEARPMLILAPMHPVLLVYDIDDTEGAELPEEIRNFARAEGNWDSGQMDMVVFNAERDRIQVQFKELGSQHGGYVTTRSQDAGWKMRIVLRNALDEQSRYSVLCHELAHIYLGHLGSDKDNWWPCRTNLTHQTVEIEAEAVSSIVCTRAGLTTSAPAYLAMHLKGKPVPATVSLELIVKVAGKLEEMGKRKLPPRKAVGDARSSTASLSK